MEIHFTVKKGDYTPTVESFLVKKQDQPCPPEIMSFLLYKITDGKSSEESRRFQSTFLSCSVDVTVDIIE